MSEILTFCKQTYSLICNFWRKKNNQFCKMYTIYIVCTDVLYLNANLCRDTRDILGCPKNNLLRFLQYHIHLIKNVSYSTSHTQKPLCLCKFWTPDLLNSF